MLIYKAKTFMAALWSRKHCLPLLPSAASRMLKL